MPVREQARAAVQRAWDAGHRVGRAAGPRRRRRAADRDRAAGQPGARRPRDEPRAEARPAVSDGARSRSPRPSQTELARESADPASASPIAAADAVAPGFLNLRLADAALERTIAAILAAPDGWGRVAPAAPRRVNVEFVSANPTGPLTVGNARGAFVGDLLCRVLEAAGQQVSREYYFNDFGTQVHNLGASVAGHPRRRRRSPRTATTATTSATSPATSRPTCSPRPRRRPIPPRTVGRWASERVRAGIEASLARLGVRFDLWKTEGSLHAEGWVERAVERLRAGGHVYELDGALWFRSTTFGDDKDRVIIRADGRPTYFAADIGYVTEKFSRGFDHLIYIWGADHHGTVARVRNAAEAMGYDKAAVEMILIAWVRFVRDGVEVSMSKRAGEFIALDDLLAEIGVDAARWYFGSRAHTSGIDLDIERLRGQRESLERGEHEEASQSPVYYVQYAHARIASILRKAAAAVRSRPRRVSRAR